ncbi:hypothetical protein [Natronomonas sp. EA1]|uniref:hypothetical protein n=1 Tax=Natronomonas sp. EA1 TaxID=3421655 RepID=UPI003EBFA921
MSQLHALDLLAVSGGLLYPGSGARVMPTPEALAAESAFGCAVAPVFVQASAATSEDEAYAPPASLWLTHMQGGSPRL